MFGLLEFLFNKSLNSLTLYHGNFSAVTFFQCKGNSIEHSCVPLCKTSVQTAPPQCWLSTTGTGLHEIHSVYTLVSPVQSAWSRAWKGMLSAQTNSGKSKIGSARSLALKSEPPSVPQQNISLVSKWKMFTFSSFSSCYIV